MNNNKIVKKAEKCVKLLKKAYPDSKCSLSYSETHELLIATILSAQCTDSRVNQVTPDLFNKYPDVNAFSHANPGELAQDIHSCGYHNQKARSIIGASIKIVEEFGEDVPGTMNALISLPGVGRKTANCVLGECFSTPSMVIDTHMIRIMNLLGFVESKIPEQIEKQLMQIFPKKEWVSLTHRIIDHGRQVCIARRPQCSQCVLIEICPSSEI